MSEETVQAGAAATTERELPLEFRAQGGEYFRIWIVNLLLSIVTIGIYSAWAKVRRLRYFYGSTLLEGSSFEYHGRPIAILKGRAIAVGAYLILIALAQVAPLVQLAMFPVFLFGVPWIIMRARLFQMRMTSWRGLRFNFHGQYGGALGAYIGWAILSTLTLFILFPYALWKQVNYIVSNTAYGTQRFTFLATKGSFYKFCLIAVAITIGAMLLLGLALGLVVGTSSILATATKPDVTPQEVLASLFSLGTLLTLLIYGAFIMLVTAAFRVGVANATLGNTRVGPHRLYSRMRILPYAGVLLTNFAGMIITLGLFYPWAKVRAMRYQFAHTGVVAAGSLDQFIADSGHSADAIGEEVSDFFDIDFGF